MNGFKVSQLPMTIQGPGNSLTSAGGGGNTQNSKFAQLMDARAGGSNLTSTVGTTTTPTTSGSSTTAGSAASGTTGSATGSATSSDQPDDATMQSMAMFFQGLQTKPAEMEDYDNDDPPPPTDGSS